MSTWAHQMFREVLKEPLGFVFPVQCLENEMDLLLYAFAEGNLYRMTCEANVCVRLLSDRL